MDHPPAAALAVVDAVTGLLYDCQCIGAVVAVVVDVVGVVILQEYVAGCADDDSVEK